MPLGEWVNLPRQSRRITGLNPVDPSVDVPRNSDDPNDMEGMSMLHIATNDVIRKFSRFDDGLKSGMLKEAVDTLKERNETRYLENFIVGQLLN